MSRSLALARREVLLPGELLPDPQPGRHHGIVLRVLKDPVRPTASVQLSDFMVWEAGAWQRAKGLRQAHLTLGDAREVPMPAPAAQVGKRQHLVVDLPVDVVMPHLMQRKGKPPPEKRPAWADRPNRKKPKAPPAEALLHGAALLERAAAAKSVGGARLAPGTRLWVRAPGGVRWPAVAWAWGLCRRKDQGELLQSFREGAGSSVRVRALQQLCELALSEMTGALPDAEDEKVRMLRLADAHMRQHSDGTTCYLELGGPLHCVHCERTFHPICLRPPAATEADLPGRRWACPSCGEEQGTDERRSTEDEEQEHDRMGLTPDWIIAATCEVFGLRGPTPSRPYIAGAPPAPAAAQLARWAWPSLLDPCTNSKVAPNVPAEKLYSKEDNGLLLSNSWGGYFVLLNPDFSAQLQWRFVNRAVDEVECGQVPGIILICRNSTDTSYFQRLTCYPRVLLRRTAICFKDYHKSAIGFGICVLCLVRLDADNAIDTFKRFCDAFSPHGELNIPIDRQLMEAPAFLQLLGRLRTHAAQHHRDHWVQCSACERWRIVDFEVAQRLAADAAADWTCAQLSPPFTSCATPLSRRELLGGHYAAGGADWGAEGGPEGAHRSDPAQATPPPPEAAGGLSGAAAVATPPQASSPQRGSGDGGQGSAGSTGDEDMCEVQQAPMLSALELGRQARIAANRAYLSALGLGAGALHEAACRRLRQQEAALRAQLAAVQGEAAAAAEQLRLAEAAAAGLGAAAEGGAEGQRGGSGEATTQEAQAHDQRPH
eukprot:scaffold40.g5161.t1